MWVKTPDKKYVNLDTNAQLSVTDTEHDKWRVLYVPSAGYGVTLQSGYSTVEDAQGALDEFAGSLDFVEVQPPVTEEEV